MSGPRPYGEIVIEPGRRFNRIRQSLQILASPASPQLDDPVQAGSLLERSRYVSPDRGPCSGFPLRQMYLILTRWSQGPPCTAFDVTILPYNLYVEPLTLAWRRRTGMKRRGIQVLRLPGEVESGSVRPARPPCGSGPPVIFAAFRTAAGEAAKHGGAVMLRRSKVLEQGPDEMIPPT